VGFTELSGRFDPAELVNLLNQIFSEFDYLAELHGLEKIKTIGDAYMVVSGLPIPRDDYAEAMADMALDMQRTLKEFNAKTQQNFNIRIGIATGPVVAGVIGIKKFIYDLWGDTVNLASRMESHGITDEIQVTEATYLALKEQYKFEKRGTILVKGKGEMTTYLLKGKKT
ncbi:adenylate/guanylate cyclase domain-containing protein, partial [Planktothrix sp.]|uniref:adenylate/guanylate cyclase domain-containing protein n=2 Tax=Planktothrix sp. TaxID=3088171 RepID=UPI0038D4104A